MWSPLLDVDRVVVAGAGPRAASVRAAAGVHRGSALLLVATGAVEDDVEELAWVAEARATRELPGTLRITVTERAPVAFATRPDGRAAVVDATGVVTEVAATPPAGLPALVTTAAPPGQGKVVVPAAAARVAAALGPLAGRVTRISVDRSEAALTLADARVVRLGDLTHLEEKSRAAAAVLDSPGLPAVTYVDVRVPSAPVTG
jgi:cell division protein FtsQ